MNGATADGGTPRTPATLCARAAELESRVPPVAAGPRCDDERMFLEKAAALRAEADCLDRDHTGERDGGASHTAATPLPLQEGDQFYAVRPSLGKREVVIRIAETPTPFDNKVWVETVGEDGRRHRKRSLDARQLHESPTTSGKPRTTGYIRLQPGRSVLPLRASLPAAGPISDLQDDRTPAALRHALDNAARDLRGMGLAVDGPADWELTTSAAEWAHRAGQLFQILSLLYAREPYAATPEEAERRRREAADTFARQRLKGLAGR